MSNPTEAAPALRVTDTLVSADCTVECFDATGKSLGMTGGMRTYGKTVKSNLTGYVNKTHGMIRRGYFKGAVRMEVKLRGRSDYETDTAWGEIKVSVQF